MSELSPAGALTVLTRLAARSPDGRRTLERALRGRLQQLAGAALDTAVETGGPIGGILAELIQAEGSINLVKSILARFDESRYSDSASLYEVRLASTQKLLAYLQEGTALPPTERDAEVARLTNNLSLSLSLLGRQQQALEVARKAVASLRNLSSIDPEHRDYQLELAVSLSNLGVAEEASGNHEIGLRATEEAVQIARKMAVVNFTEATPVLAQNLLNLGSILFSTGSTEEALAVTHESASFFQQLTERDPKTFRDLARSLNNLGAILRSLGRFDEALEVISRGLELRRSLAHRSDYSEMLLADLAASLQNVAITLREQASRKKEALSASREAVEIRRRIAAGGGTATLLELVDSLEALSATLLDIGDDGPALEAIMESIEILQRAEAQQPGGAAQRLRTLLDRLKTALDRTDLAVDPTRRIASLEKVIRAVAFFFCRQPLIFTDPMNTALLTYLNTLLRTGREPDRELLGLIIRSAEEEILKGSSGQV